MEEDQKNIDTPEKTVVDDREVLMNLRPKTMSEMFLWQKSFIQELFGSLRKAETEIGVLKSELQEAIDAQVPSKAKEKLKNANIERAHLIAQNKNLKRKNEELLEKIRKYESNATTV